jgi:DnaD/phage-associated family protein
MKGFPGFPPGETRLVTLPEPIFSELLPLIDDLDELKVTLHCYWRLSQGQGAVRFVRRNDLMMDGELMTGLKGDCVDEDSVGALGAALERAVARGTLLHARVEREGETEDWYFANTPKGRAAMQQIERGELPIGTPTVTRTEATRPNIFVLYEQNIGLLQNIIADELRQAEQDYPAEWIEEAFHLAAEANVRRWSYVRAILERWLTEGKTDGTSRRDSESDYRRYIKGKYADHIEY